MTLSSMTFINSDSLAESELETEQSSLLDLAVQQRVSGYLALGRVTLHSVQDTLDLSVLEDRLVLCTLYSEWLLDDAYLVMEKTIDRLRLDGDATRPGERVRLTEWQAVKARKRGNDIDAWRIDGRMRTLQEGILPYCQSVEGEKALRTTRALYVTLTVNPDLTDGSLESAWLHVGRWFNDFKSRLSSTFGTVHADVKDGEFVETHSRCKIHVLRSWEAHASGWPHVHAVLCFEGFDFKMFKDANDSWRIKLKDRFEDAWPYGFVDVKALTPGTAERELTNVLWYVSKNLSSMDYRLVDSWPAKRLLTQSILWYYGLRSFSVSRTLLASDSEPDQDDSTTTLSTIQNDLFGNGLVVDLVSWKFVGLVRRKDTELAREDWEKTYSDPPSWLDCCWKPYSSRHGSAWGSSWTSVGD